MGYLGNQLVNKHVFIGRAPKDSWLRVSESWKLLRMNIVIFPPKWAAMQQAQWILSADRMGKRHEGELPQPYRKERCLDSGGHTLQTRCQEESLSKSREGLSQYQETWEEIGDPVEGWWRRNIYTRGQGSSFVLLPNSVPHSSTVREH